MQKRKQQAQLSAGTGRVSQRLILGILLVLLTLAAFAGVHRNGFVRYDDDDYIARNPQVTQGLSWQGARWAFTDFHAANWHPLTWLSHMLDVTLFGLHPAGHHLVSLFLHTCSVLFLFWFLCRTTGNSWPAAFVAAMFAIHPLHVESVAWAAERKDVLCALFWFAAMLAYASYADRPGILRYLAVLVLFALSLLSKPMAVTFPFVLILLDYWPLQRFSIERSDRFLAISSTSLRRLLLEKVPFLALTVISCLITLKAQTTTIANVELLSIQTRFANAAVSYGRYAWSMVWPTGLAVFYPFETTWFAAKVVCSILLLFAGTAAAILLHRKYRYVAVGWFWYILTLVPVIGLVQVGWQSHADRYTYIPLTGLFIAIAWASMDVASRKPRLRRALAACGILVALILAAMTFRQVSYWNSALSLCKRAVDVTAHNPAMLANLGTMLSENGQTAEGLAALQEADKSLPDNAGVATALGLALSRAGRYQESVPVFERALRLQPQSRDALAGIAAALSRLNRLKEAEGYCRALLKVAPADGEGWLLLGVVLGQQARFDEALDAFSRSAEAQPPVPMARLNIAKLYIQKGDLEKALDECRKCIAQQPNYAAYELMASVLTRLGRTQEAAQAHRQAAMLNPAGQ
jgi:protein O-mannosyl-transferase